MLISSLLFQQIEKKIIDVLKSDTTWDLMKKFVRAVFPMLIVLRLADKKEPVMDKLYFYVRRMDRTLLYSKEILDHLEGQTQGLSWHLLREILNNGDLADTDDKSEASNDAGPDTDSTSDEDDNQDNRKSLSTRVIDIWTRRRVSLISDFAIAGWILSPIPEIYEDSKVNLTADHHNAVDRLLKKMMASDLADDSEELANIMNTFWEEYEQFKSKSGHFDKDYIWSSQNWDLLLGKSYIWHKKNSFVQTKVLGRFACRVCSKIVGMGSAERNWGDVKYLKSEKRAHLSPEAVQKQATIFGASCMADAALERQRAQDNATDPYKFWDEDDFDKEFDIFASPREVNKNDSRVLKCYFEEWEEEHILKKDDLSKAKFLQKYGGLEFEDIDNGTRYTIHPTDLHYQRRSKTDRGGWCVKAFNEEEQEYEPWSFYRDDALHDCLCSYYQRHPEKNVKLVLRKGQAEAVAKLYREAEKKRQRDVEKKQRGKLSPPKKKKSQTDDAMGPCGGCGQQVASVHKCDLCGCNMHPFCGRTIGEEGYGSSVRCPSCDNKNK